MLSRLSKTLRPVDTFRRVAMQQQQKVHEEKVKNEDEVRPKTKFEEAVETATGVAAAEPAKKSAKKKRDKKKAKPGPDKEPGDDTLGEVSVGADTGDYLRQHAVPQFLESALNEMVAQEVSNPFLF